MHAGWVGYRHTTVVSRETGEEGRLRGGSNDGSGEDEKKVGDLAWLRLGVASRWRWPATWWAIVETERER